MHRVKCLYCGEYFDTDTTSFIKPRSNRYAHKVCPVKNKTDIEIAEINNEDAFWQYIKKLYGPKYNYVKLKSFAEKYIRDYSFTWSGMLKALKWFYEIKKNPKDNIDYESIGIIPYIYEDAKKYYRQIYNAQKKNKNVEVRARLRTVFIQSPRAHHPRPRLFDLDKED